LNGDGELFRPAISERVTVLVAVETVRYLAKAELAVGVPELPLPLPEVDDEAAGVDVAGLVAGVELEEGGAGG
jgi:hypothetical protein